MANIKVKLHCEPVDGQSIAFVAPCDCSEIEGIKVCYLKNGVETAKTFLMKDAHGNVLTGIGNLFGKNAYVKALLDTKNGFAYLQNADTNAYLEARIPVVTIGAMSAGYPKDPVENQIHLMYED